MTCTHAAAADDAGPDDTATVPAKSVLFCPECGYRAHAEGPWNVRTDGDTREVYCPRCESRIA